MFEKSLQDLVKGIRAHKRDPAAFVSTAIAVLTKAAGSRLCALIPLTKSWRDFSNMVYGCAASRVDRSVRGRVAPRRFGLQQFCLKSGQAARGDGVRGAYCPVAAIAMRTSAQQAQRSFARLRRSKVARRRRELASGL